MRTSISAAEEIEEIYRASVLYIGPFLTSRDCDNRFSIEADSTKAGIPHHTHDTQYKVT